jgi:putative ABC transport system permease protein
MKKTNFALSNIKGNTFRSLIIFLCVMSLSTFLFAITLIINGVQHSLNVGLDRLGADIIVVPTGAESRIESALLMGKPTNMWMPSSKMQDILAVAGVKQATPQIYLQSLYGSDCCSVSEMFLMVYDPATDFIINPWLKRTLGQGLQPGEVFGGIYVYVPPGQKAMRIFGSLLDLKGNLEATGTGLDQTLFMTMETARKIAADSVSLAIQPLNIPADNISTVMVKIDSSQNTHRVALDIQSKVAGVAAIESPNLFGLYRQQMNGLLWGFFAILIVIWAVVILLIGLVFSMITNERRREIAVLRALGATRFRAVEAILVEASLLALGAGVLGSSLAAVVTFAFRNMLAASLKMPFLFPSIASLMVLGAGSVLLALITVSLAALFPALRITKHEPAIAMRE